MACEEACTSHDACVGYSYDLGTSGYCNLYPDQRTCPSGFRGAMLAWANIATTKDDLVAVDSADFVCKAKISGNVH